MSESNSSIQNYSRYAFISIGGNLPSDVRTPEEIIAFAFAEIAELSLEPILKSSVYSSSPVESPPGTPNFLNALSGIVPREKETPLSLLYKLQEIENEAGRTRSGVKNEARILDLDLITFADEIVNVTDLNLPHPRASERKFVLAPMIEIVGKDFIFPGMEESLGSLLSQTDDKQIIRRI